MILRSTNPFTGETIKEFEEDSFEKVDNLIGQSREAFKTWRKTTFEYRRSLMEESARLIRRNLNEYAVSITSEVGKPVRESRAEIEKCAWVCEYYAKNAERFLKAEPADTDADISYVNYEPNGTVLGIMPWIFDLF